MDLKLYDTTLRDGAQRAGISFSVEDKRAVAKRLDDLGIHYIEAGWPGSNPKDAEFFRRAGSLKLTHAVLVAFSSTRRAHIDASDDENLKALMATGLQIFTLVGKAWDLHVTDVLQTDLEENLKMIADSIRYLKSKGHTIFFDAEHFFDGYKSNPQYAIQVVRIAAEAGSDSVVLCDTNGGSLPREVTDITTVVKDIDVPLGIHAHNDSDLAVVNTLVAVQAGVTQVQGTINGYGERCGNANLCSVIPTLKLKMGVDCVTDQQLHKLTEVSHFVSEIANLSPDPHLPYVGNNAFTHKGGLHVSGLMRRDTSYQHIDPSLVGNRSQVLVSELSGMSNVIYKAEELGLNIKKGKQAKIILDTIKSLESEGFQYEGAEASFEMLIKRTQEGYKPAFELVDFMVVIEKRRRSPTTPSPEDVLSEAMVKVRVGTTVFHTAAEGNGPVNALDAALRKALLQFYPNISVVKLIDYKVRILEESQGTEAKVRVLIESGDGDIEWRTVGCSTNIIEASWFALEDSMEYWLLRQGCCTA